MLNNLIKISIILVFVSIAYYFFVFQPRQAQQQINSQQAIQQQSNLANKEKCVIAGEKLAEQDKQHYTVCDYTTAQCSEKYEWAKYAYNSKLNTCLYEYAYIIFGDNKNSNTSWIGTIEDSLTTNIILTSIVFMNSDLSFLNKDEEAKSTAFFRQADSLMGTYDPALYGATPITPTN